jgi:hypothetical protein
LRSVFEVLPTAAWSLDELVHIASVRLAHLKKGEAIVKIGIRPPARIRSVHVKDGWARPEHIERITDSLAAATSYITPVEEAVANYRKRRRDLIIRIASTPTDNRRAGGDKVGESLPALDLKDEGWG